jgi:hypothetical protein
LRSGSVDTTTGLPTKLVRNIGPYLKATAKTSERMKEVIIGQLFEQLCHSQDLYLFILSLTNGEMSQEVFGAKN